MTVAHYIVIALGAVFALLGIFLFSRHGAHGENKVKLLGAEFQLSGSALVIFVVGAVMVLAPLITADTNLTQDEGQPSQPLTGAVPATKS